MLTPDQLEAQWPGAVKRCNGVSCSLRLRGKLLDIDRRVRDQLSGPIAKDTKETHAVPEAERS